jgi:pyruvate dehydrogenase complex dehydrogenase (E1) component
MAAHFVAETDDSIETREWLDSVDALVAMHCVPRARQCSAEPTSALVELVSTSARN